MRTFGRILCALTLILASQAVAQEGSSPIGEMQEHQPDEFDQTGPLRDLYKDVASELRCPTCTGLSVLESDAKFSVQIKDIVKEKIREGKSKEEILAYFTERYGPWILREPPKTGFNLIAWVLPIGTLIMGPILVWLFVWRRRRVVTSYGVRSVDEILAEMEARLESLRAKG